MAVIECSTVNIGQTPLITIKDTGNATAWTLTYEFGSHSGTIATRTTATRFTNYAWPLTFYYEIPNATEGKGVLLLDLYNGSTPIGTAFCPFTALVNKSASTPTISLPTITDANAAATALTGSNSKFIRYVSTAAVSLTATARNGAAIRSVVVTNNARGVEATTGDVAVAIPNMDSTKFSVIATDSRGLTTSITYEIENEDLIPYVKLTCNAGNEIPDTDGNIRLTCSGNYYNGSFGVGANTLAVQCRYKEQGGDFGAWRTMTISRISNGTYSAYASLSGLDYRKTYIFECQASDEFMTVSSESAPSRALPVFHWSADNFTFEVPVTFKQGATGIEGGSSGSNGTVDGDLQITGNLRLKGSGNYGNILYFGDGSYCYLKEETDDDLTIKASDLNLNVSNLYLNGGAIKAGTWTPTLTTAAAVSSYTTQSGWYVRVGNVVTVGFNIAVSCKSGYNSTALAISGLPFTPATNAFGGGVMFGAYVNAGFCFEAWAAATTGQITPRLQPCNNTSAGNLQIASTAYYPSGTASMTLGGTITYITN